MERQRENKGKETKENKKKKMDECTDGAEAMDVQVCVINTRYLLNFLFDVCFHSWFQLWEGLRGNPKGLTSMGQVRSVSRNQKPLEICNFSSSS